MLKNTPIITIYDYNNNKLTDIYTNDVSASHEYGSVSTLDFKVPYYHYDANDVLLYKDNGEKAINPKVEHLLNENIVKFDGDYYLIKNTKKIRDDDLYFSIECIGFATELSYKNISFLTTKPPETNPLKITSNILYTLTARNEKARGIVTNFTSNTITLDGNLPTTTDEFAGDYIAVIDGVGQGYNYEIASSSNNTITINGSLTESLEADKSLCIIHDSKYSVGDVDDAFLINENSNPIYRSFKFENKSIMASVNDIATRMDGFLTFNAKYDDFYGGFICEVGLKETKETYKNVEFRYDKNLDGVTRELDTIDNIYTAIYPYGDDNLRINSIPDKDRTDSGVTYLEHQEGQSYIENYQYYLSLGYSLEFCRKNFFNDMEVTDTLYVDRADLYRDHKDMLDRLSKPKTIYSIKGTDLSFFQGYDYTKFKVGDKIRVYDSELGVSIFANVVKQTINYSKPDVLNIELSNIVDAFSDYIVEHLTGLKEYTNDKTDRNEDKYQESNYNLLNNGGCELNLKDGTDVRFWDTVNNNITLTTDTTNSISGSASFKLNDTTGTSGNESATQLITNIIPERDYTASCTILSDNCDCELIIEEVDASNNVLRSHVKSYKPLIFSIQDLVLTFKTESDTDKLRYKVKKYSSADNNPSNVIFDNCKLETGEEKTPYIEIESDVEYYNNNTVYYGVSLNQALGLEIVREDKLARVQFNADKLTMQTGDGSGNYEDGLRFEPSTGEYVFSGTVEASTFVGATLEINPTDGGGIFVNNGIFSVDEFGTMIAQDAKVEGEFQTIGSTGLTTSRIYQEGNVGGRLELFDNDNNLNVVLGDADGRSSNIGGTLTLHNRSSIKPRVELGISQDEDAGLIQVKNTTNTVTGLIYGGSNLGDEGIIQLSDSVGTANVRFWGDSSATSYVLGSLAIGETSASSANKLQIDGNMFATRITGSTVRSSDYQVLDGFSYISGATGNFTTSDGKTVDVINGLITSIV